MHDALSLRCFVISFVVRAGHDVRWSHLITLRIVHMVGLNNVAEEHWANYCFVESKLIIPFATNFIGRLLL